MTVSSFRVFMPSLAHQLMIAKERRQYLGTWTEKDTADVYTREHGIVVTCVWREVLEKFQDQQSSSQAGIFEVDGGLPLVPQSSAPPNPCSTDLTHPGCQVDVQSTPVNMQEFPVVPRLGKRWPLGCQTPHPQRRSRASSTDLTCCTRQACH